MAYTLAVATVAGNHAAMVAYTATSQPWSGALRHGVMIFDSAEAAGLGRAPAFVLDLRRLAYLPLTAAWFTRTGEEGPACSHAHRRHCEIG